MCNLTFKETRTSVWSKHNSQSEIKLEAQTRADDKKILEKYFFGNQDVLLTSSVEQLLRERIIHIYMCV